MQNNDLPIATTTIVTLNRDLIFATQMQTIYVLFRKKTLLRLIFKCVFEDTFSNYGRASFHIAEIIVSFTKFCNFRETMCALDEYFC